jgi:hypothetical protein
MAAKRKAGTRLLTGQDDIDKQLSKLKIGVANKVARPALTKAARHLLKATKAKVPPDKKPMKRAMGMAVDTKGGRNRNQQRAKVGAGVGKASKAEATRSGKNTGGVGIGGPNIHWAVLGTEDRTTKAGKSTGAMPPIMPNLMNEVAAEEKAAVETIIRDEVTARLEKLVATK